MSRTGKAPHNVAQCSQRCMLSHDMKSLQKACHTGKVPHRGLCIGEDTAFQPLVPDLIAALNSADRAAALAAVGKRYVAAMRARVPRNSPNPDPARIVDKMLRNAWNVGHIAIALPRAQVVRNRACGMLLVSHDAAGSVRASQGHATSDVARSK